ncbi:unnamed protein product [Oikopleura dioica]|uniref:Uncharacterized protein n=1 Tax=Oikopleura dioica TaxID=34765 RepID=E4X8J8_OIKDI|nr:unnamed protein product [Oikopleura dioica]
MKIIIFFLTLTFACPEKWVEDATSGICVPAGAFNFVCISDGTASLTLELEHFYKDLPDDKSALESLLQLNDGWSRRHSSVHDVNLFKKTTSLSFSQTIAEKIIGSYTIGASALGITTVSYHQRHNDRHARRWCFELHYRVLLRFFHVD